MYHPDIELGMERGSNKIIEVKSSYTFNANKKVNRAKRDAVLASGYKYELWIFNKSGERTSLLK